MKLNKVHFDAFKSLLRTELAIEKNCIGLVGINETGKTNILRAISILGKDRDLKIRDRPKVAERPMPGLRFDFTFNKEEKKEILEIFNSWIENNSKVKAKSNSKITEATYHIECENSDEVREYFTINNLVLDEDVLVLKKEYQDSNQCVVINEQAYRLNESIIINQDILDQNNELRKLSKDLKEIKLDLNNSKKYKSLSDKYDTESINDKTLKKKVLRKIKIEESIGKSGFSDFKDEANEKIKEIKKQIKSNKTRLSRAGNQQKKDKINLKLEELEKELQKAKNELEKLDEPLNDKYINNFELLTYYIESEIKSYLHPKLPDITFWEYSKDYVLQSEYEFDDIKKINDLDSISRPLLNIFRLTQSVKTIDDLKKIIEHIQNDSSERSKIERDMNRRLNDYIHSVWGDYDQDFHIRIEEERVRFKITDPKFDDAHYYDMEERSQGCQTFISFLLTIGAEANKGVIQDSILLLDEPEAHLHPSGVRFMLKELIKISKVNNNIVLYATHSGDMIDTKEYDRHVIVRKVNERTILEPSVQDRVGYFMQEEVLFKALDIDLTDRVASKEPYNFVFEGDGDVRIFKHYYNNILRHDVSPKRPFPLNRTRFYQGGKCSKIKYYFNKKPIQLGSKWIFVLDNDIPGKKLKQFIEGKYKEYIGKDIFVLQYPVEFEDILPNSIIYRSFTESCLRNGFKKSYKKIKQIIIESKTYKEVEVNLIREHPELKGYKGDFKERLNYNLAEQSKRLKNEKEFKGVFPKYEKWVKEELKKLTSSEEK